MPIPRTNRPRPRSFARIAPDLYVSLSHEVNPEWREYERTASTVANAYIGPPVSRYLHTLEELSLRRFPQSRALMMKSDGGAASARMLARTPIQTVMSGPVAGVIGGRHLGDVKGIENLITFDTGGTSSDMAVLPGRPLFKSEVTVARHPLRTHTVDIETIGAGGGSIASVQLGGVLKVGPQSAGAHPGPACYDRGGSEPTLTDALVLLGHLNPTALLEGAMPIAERKAREAVVTRVAGPLGISPIEAAWGILRVLATNVVVAMRTITVERGYDPREFTLVPFGGMGPTIAGLIAAELGIGRILDSARSRHIQRLWDAGHRRAAGAQRHPHHAGRSHEPAELDAIFAGDGTRGAARSDAGAISARAPADAPSRRHALSRPVLRGVACRCRSCAGADDLAALIARFHAAHQRRYGHMAQAEAVEIVNFQVTAIGLIPKPATQNVRCAGRGRSATPTSQVTQTGLFQRDRGLRGAGVAARRPPAGNARSRARPSSRRRRRPSCSIRDSAPRSTPI